MLGHYAGTDDFAPPEKALAMGKAIRDAGGTASIHVYGGTGHAFFNDENPFGPYDEGSARVAWDRTIAHLEKHVS